LASAIVRDVVLLADAERREDLAEQVVARELARELAERRLRAAKLLGGELERRVELVARRDEPASRALERREVSAARAERPGRARVVAGERVQVRDQRVEALAGQRRDREDRDVGAPHRGAVVDALRRRDSVRVGPR